MDLENNNHSVFSLNYHLVLVIKYRRDVIDDTISITCAEYPVHKRSDGRG